MSLAAFAGGEGLLLAPWPFLGEVPNIGNATVDAAGESLAFCGRIWLSSGPGTSKTLSSSGGKIHWRPGATNTFANGGTNFRIGVQDIGATGLNDDSWSSEPQADLVGGTDTITASVVNSTPMESGSRSITHGDLIAVVFEMTTRGGVADSIQIQRQQSNFLDPWAVQDTGSGPAKLSQGVPLVTIEFDDGTVGWFGHGTWAHAVENATAFASNSTPDEYALVFEIPFPAMVVGLAAQLHSVISTDDFELILYSDPLGTPVAERTITYDMDVAQAGSKIVRTLTSTYQLAANTKYAVALRPTTTNTLGFVQVAFNTGNGVLRKATANGTSWSKYSRTNQSGAFGSEDQTALPLFGVLLGQFDSGGGSGGPVSANMRGGFQN